MASRTKLHNSLLEAGAGDSEDDLAGVNAVTQNKRVNNTTKDNKAKAMPRRASTAKNTTATKRKAPPKQNRQALKDRTNIQDGSDTEEVENFDEDDANPKAKRAKTTATRKQTSARAKTQPVQSKALQRALGVIPETQPDPDNEDVSQSIEEDPDNMDITTVPTPPRAQKFIQRARSTSVQPTLQARPVARATSAQPLQARPSARSASAQPGYPPIRERSGSASGTERERRGGDPEMRRKLNDLTKKYENLNLKYQNLQEIGQSTAESNFEKLKRASDQKAKDANELIASLKKELAELRKSPASSSSSSETTGLQKQVNSLSTNNTHLTNENANIKNSLQVSQNEVKSLEAKLVAARQQLSNSASAQENNKSAPASEAKNNLNRSVGPNATDAQKDARMKENLYSDLTGLIIRGVKRKEGEDEYDCIQTGRNGSKFHTPFQNTIIKAL